MRLVTRIFLGEIRKFWSPLTIGLILIGAVFIWQDLSRTEFYAHHTSPTAVGTVLFHEEQVADLCPSDGNTPTASCQRARAQLAINSPGKSEGMRLAHVASALSTLPGLVRFVAHQYTSGLGWMFVVLLAAVHVTREESRGTVGQSILTIGRIPYLAVKALSTFAMTMLAIGVTALAMYALRFTFVRAIEIPSGVTSAVSGYAMTGMHTVAPDATWSSWSGALAALGAAAIVLAVVAIVYSVVAAQFRRPLSMVFAGGGSVALFFGLAQWAKMGRIGPMGPIGKLAGLDNVPYGIFDVRLWDLHARPSETFLLSSWQPMAGIEWGVLIVWGLAAFIVVTLCVLAYRTRNFSG